MACSRCARWQQHIRLGRTTSRPSSLRTFSTKSACQDQAAAENAEQQSTSKELELSILNHKRRRFRGPNERPRSAVHDIDLSQRIGTRYSRPVVGAMEWQTSTYHYNKQTTKAYPVLANTTNKLLEAFAVMEEASGGKKKISKQSLADKRKETNRVYMSNAAAKDFGNKIVLDVFVHDGLEAAKEAARGRVAKQTAKQEQMKAKREQRQAGKDGPARPASPARRTGFRGRR